MDKLFSFLSYFPHLKWRWEGGSGWGTHVNPWLIHVNVWQKPLQYCKVISLQLIKINEKKNRDDGTTYPHRLLREVSELSVDCLEEDLSSNKLCDDDDDEMM